MPYNAEGFVCTNNFIGAVSDAPKKQYSYITNDTKSNIESAGYFNQEASRLKVGDLIDVGGDIDGTPFHTSYVVSSNNGTTVALTEHAAVTQNVKNYVTVRVPVLGTASTQYVVIPRAGAITKVLGVSNANGATATGTITITVPTTGAVATLPFTSSYAAGTAIEDTTITAHTLAANAVVTVATDGGGDGTGEVLVTLEITPS